MSQHSITQSLLNVVLVLAESALTFILRFDPNLRQAAYPLVKKDTTVCIRTYLPHTEFYATFTHKGILLDSELPRIRKDVDVIINTYTHQLLGALISNEHAEISKLTMRGRTETIAELRHFFVQLGIVSLFQSIIRNIKGKDKDDTDGANAKDSEKPDYQARIKEQQQQLNTLSIRNRELEMTVKEIKSKQKVTLIALVIVSIIAIIALIGWLT